MPRHAILQETKNRCGGISKWILTSQTEIHLKLFGRLASCDAEPAPYSTGIENDGINWEWVKNATIK